MQTARVDLSKIDSTYIFNVMQEDTDRQIRIELFDDGELYEVSGDTVSVWYEGSSGDAGNFSEGIVKEANALIITLDEHMTKNPGKYTLAVMLTRAGGNISTWNMVVNVSPLPGRSRSAAEEYFGAFSLTKLAKDIEALNARIENIVANAGDVGGNTELTDIRLGWDGTTYSTAGEAVRKQTVSSDKLACFITPAINVASRAFNSFKYSYNDGTAKLTPLRTGIDLFYFYSHKGVTRLVTTIQHESKSNYILFDKEISSTIPATKFSAIAGDEENKELKIEPLIDAYEKNHYVFAIAYKSTLITGPNQRLFASLDANNSFIKDEIVSKISSDFKTIDAEQKQNLLSSFRSIGVIGDSLSVGYLQNTNTNTPSGRNLYYSWPQYMARKTGQHVINMGASGYNVKTWMSSERYGWGVFSKPENYCQLYIIGLGVNDSSDSDRGVELGTIADVNLSNYENNADTYYGGYAKIIQRGRTIRPNSIFLCLTNPCAFNNAVLYNNAIKEIVTHLNDPKVFVVDLYEYRDYYNVSGYVLKEDKDVIKSHYSPVGYEAMVPIISEACSRVMLDHMDIFGQLFTIDDAFDDSAG